MVINSLPETANVCSSAILMERKAGGFFILTNKFFFHTMSASVRTSFHMQKPLPLNILHD